MGYIPSADTVYAVAYLTETGRDYLFNKNDIRFDTAGDDLFEITKFTLSDGDTNYQTLPLLETGEVPDVTGKGEGCLKATANYVQNNLIAFVFDDTPTNVDYDTDLTNDTITIIEGSLPVVSGGETPITPSSGGGGSSGFSSGVGPGAFTPA